MNTDIQCSIMDQKYWQAMLLHDNRFKEAGFYKQPDTSSLTEAFYLSSWCFIPRTSQKHRGNHAQLWGKREENPTSQQQLENDIHWIVVAKQSFTTIESPAFRQIFLNIPGITLPFISRHTLRQRLMDGFILQRAQLKEELGVSCKTIAISLDIRTSENHLPILEVIGHWLQSALITKKGFLNSRRFQVPTVEKIQLPQLKICLWSLILNASCLQ